MSGYFKLFVSLVLFVGFITTVQANTHSSECPESFQSSLDISGIQKIFSDKQNHTRYKGQEGYLLFTQRALNINSMGYVHQIVSKALGEIFKKLGWQQFQGTVEEFQDLRGKILNSNGSLKDEYSGMGGYAGFANEHYGGDMLKAFKNVSAVLDKALFKKTGWQQFHGTVEEFQDLRGKILNSDETLKKEYSGMGGYAGFANEHYEGDMQKAFKNVSAVVDKALFKKTGWQAFHGTVEKFQGLRGKILNSDGTLKEEYLGMTGYAGFANEHYGENMQKAFINVSAVLDKALFKKTGWQAFHGTVEKFQGLRGKILNSDGTLKEEYLGMTGYAGFANEHYGGDMLKAFINVSAVLDKALFKKTGWQQFHGTEEEFQNLRDKILNSNGTLKEEYLGMTGYARFANEHYNGDMQKAFMNVSAVLDKALFKKTGWQAFHGTVEKFQGLRGKILNSDGTLKEEYLGMTGYAGFANEHYEGDMQKAFKNVSAVLDKALFKKTGWQQFQGTVKEFQDLRGKILNSDETLKEEYLGMTGYAGFANEHYGGDMLKAFINVSAVLGGHSNMKALGLEWKSFSGNIDEYQNLIQLFQETEITEFQGIEGQQKVAEKIFKNELKRTYRNVSTLREILLGSREAFTDLEWAFGL